MARVCAARCTARALRSSVALTGGTVRLCGAAGFVEEGTARALVCS